MPNTIYNDQETTYRPSNTTNPRQLFSMKIRCLTQMHMYMYMYVSIHKSTCTQLYYILGDFVLEFARLTYMYDKVFTSPEKLPPAMQRLSIHSIY